MLGLVLVAKLHVKDKNHLISELALLVLRPDAGFFSLELFDCCVLVIVAHVSVLLVGCHELKQRLEDGIK